MKSPRPRAARILIANEQARRASAPRLRRLAQWLLARATDLSPALALDELSLALVDDVGIARVNERFLRHAGPTDVISFAYPAARSAEIVLNVQRAIEVAGPRGDASRELALYLAHGIQHLAGRDDATPAQRRAMWRVQSAWLRGAARAGLAGQLIRTGQP